MCMGALPPQDHPHVFCDVGEDIEYVCPYCSTLYRHNPALALGHWEKAAGGVFVFQTTSILDGRGDRASCGAHSPKMS